MRKSILYAIPLILLLALVSGCGTTTGKATTTGFGTVFQEQFSSSSSVPGVWSASNANKPYISWDSSGAAKISSTSASSADMYHDLSYAQLPPGVYTIKSKIAMVSNPYNNGYCQISEGPGFQNYNMAKYAVTPGLNGFQVLVNKTNTYGDTMYLASYRGAQCLYDDISIESRNASLAYDLIIDTVSGSAGSTVTIPIRVEFIQNKTVAGVQAQIQFDPNSIDSSSITVDSPLGFAVAKNIIGGNVLVVAASSGTGTAGSLNTVLLNIHAKLKSGISKGSKALVFNSQSVFNQYAGSISVNPVNGAVNVG